MSVASCPVLGEERLWDLLDDSIDGLERDELESHVAGCAVCRSRLQELQGVHANLELVGQTGTAPVPETIGPYRVVGLIGEGGMGVVYEAEQASPARRVAVKVLRPLQQLDEHALRAFRREVGALARLNHPAIAAIHDAGQTESGQPYFAMRLVEGRPIDRYVAAANAGPREVCALMARVARAIHFAHQRGILHRDLKPAHVVVDATGDPHVLDFGLAQPLHDDTGLSLSLSGARVVGTLPYMSPEQARGDADAVDTRSDVYALGVLLYEVLTGSRPFDVPSNVIEAARVIGERQPEHPTDRLPGVPRELGDVVLKALAKEPDRRYASAAALADDLERFLAGEAVAARPASLGYQLWVFARRHRVLVASGAVMLTVLTAAVVAVSLALVEADRAEGALAAELRHSRALNLASAADQAADADPVAALLLARKAIETRSSPETLGSLQTALAEQYQVARLHGHTGPISCGDVAPRSGRLLTGSDDGTVRLWSEDGRELLVLPHDGRVLSAAFSRDEGRLLTVAEPEPGRQIARSFRDSGELLAEFGRTTPPLVSVAWHPEGSRVLTLGADRVVRERSVPGESVRVLGEVESLDWARVRYSAAGHTISLCRTSCCISTADRSRRVVLATRGTRDIAMDPRGEFIATAHGDRKARLWSWTGRLLAKLEGHTYLVNSVGFSASGDSILTASGDGTARLWTRDGRQKAVLNHGGEVLGARFFGSESRVLVWNGARAALWNTNGRRLAELRSSTGLWPVAFAPSAGRVLAAGGTAAGVWSLAGVEAMHLRGPADRPWAVACGPTGEVAASSESGLVTLFGGDGRLLRVLDSGTRTPTYGVAISRDGSRVVAGGLTQFCGWDLPSGEKRWQQRLPGFAGTDVHFLADPNLVVASSAPSRTAYLIDLEAGTHEVLRPRPGGHRVFVAPDGRRFAISGRSGNSRDVWLYDERATKLAEWSPAPETSLWTVAFGPRGRWLGTALDDGRVQLWDLAEVLADPVGAAPRRTFHHEVPAYCVAFSPEGDRVVVGTAASAYVADLDGNKEFRVRPRDYRSTVCFSADGRWLVSGAFDGARRWPAHRDQLLRTAEKWAVRLGGHRDLREYAELLRPIRAR